MHSAIAALRKKETNLVILKERERYNTEYQRRRDMKERLENAKQRATQLRAAANIENRMRANNVLVIR